MVQTLEAVSNFSPINNCYVLFPLVHQVVNSVKARGFFFFFFKMKLFYMDSSVKQRNLLSKTSHSLFSSGLCKDKTN